jgi:hypothetical protein
MGWSTWQVIQALVVLTFKVVKESGANGTGDDKGVDCKKFGKIWSDGISIKKLSCSDSMRKVRPMNELPRNRTTSERFRLTLRPFI